MMDRWAFHAKKKTRLHRLQVERKFQRKRRRQGFCPHHLGFPLPCERHRQQARLYYAANREKIKRETVDRRATLIAAGLCRDCKADAAPFKRCKRHRTWKTYREKKAA